jgi:hypothetical protein
MLAGLSPRSLASAQLSNSQAFAHRAGDAESGVRLGGELESASEVERFGCRICDNVERRRAVSRCLTRRLSDEVRPQCLSAMKPVRRTSRRGRHRRLHAAARRRTRPPRRRVRRPERTRRRSARKVTRSHPDGQAAARDTLPVPARLDAVSLPMLDVRRAEPVEWITRVPARLRPGFGRPS